MAKKDPKKNSTEEEADFGLPKVEVTPLNTPEESISPTIPVASPGQQEEKIEKEKQLPVTPVTPIIKSSFSDRKPRRRSNTWIYFILLLILIFGVLGAWYTLFYQTEEKDTLSSIPVVEEETKAPVQERPAETDVIPETDAPAEQEPENPASSENISPAGSGSTAARGTLTEITSRSTTPRFYLVVGSFIDEDLAMDHSKKLNGEGKNTFLVHPAGNANYYRLAVGQFDTFQQASAEIPNYQANYKDNLWVLKY